MRQFHCREIRRREQFRIVPSARRGWMLIELLIALTIVGIAAGTACFLISKMIRISQIQADGLVRDRTLHLWTEQFRLDSRSAQTARIIREGSTTQIQFQQPSGAVTYLPISTGLERRVNNQLAGRWECGGEWSFSLIADGKVAHAEQSRPEELSASEKLPNGSRALPRHLQLRVEAAIGRAP